MADWAGEVNRVYCCGQWWNVDGYEEYTSLSGTTYAEFNASPMQRPWTNDNDDRLLWEITMEMRVPIGHIIAVAKEEK